MIILIGSHKGGVGKSTQFINVLMCLLLKGKKVVLLECDDQRSIKMWIDERREKKIPPDFDYHECYTNIRETALRLAKKNNIVLIDAPGRKSPEFRKCLSVADLFISLVDPTAQIEVNTLGEMVVDVKWVQSSINLGLKAFIVMNRCPTDPRDRDASTFYKMMNDDKDWLRVAHQRIYQRTAHKRAYNNALSVYEYNDKLSNKARGELDLLLAELGII
ncbi:ParA family protein [Candidatus Fukatsuia symbiotica]|uniref:Peptidyl-arginine deiminase n=2 Tax=Candidatus Fukatsuia symbiotica TaxID=1878942 RepID=A0A2U8I8U6_9GAMM|nr:ParA family protein [Candidatus Fukatsuia symbiotica]AWK15602.1 peptidyl-arginine deiminase [Candidatus Fukatsuia symbiotica]MEA9446241.1 ParA family protein [Candidatus Fukatsuia symbiotica]